MLYKYMMFGLNKKMLLFITLITSQFAYTFPILKRPTAIDMNAEPSTQTTTYATTSNTTPLGLPTVFLHTITNYDRLIDWNIYMDDII